MMIPILTDYYAAGYLPDPKPNAIPPYLPNVNLAIRRKLLEEIEGYDENCDAGEDADLCLRAARSGWALYFEPAARTSHEPRRSLRDLIRQWIWYGKGGSHFFFKQQEKRAEIFLDLDLTPKLHCYRRVLATRWFPVPAMVFLSAFLLIHLIALPALLALAAGMIIPGSCLLFLCFTILCGLYLHSPLRRLSWNELILYAAMAFVINWTCILAGFLAGLKKGRIFIYPGI